MRDANSANSANEQLDFQLRCHGLTEYVRELAFAKPRRWRWDFAWPDKKLAVEVEGGIFVGGRHTRGAGFRSDCEKHSMGAILGWRLVRVTTDHIRTGEAIDWIKRALGTLVPG